MTLQLAKMHPHTKFGSCRSYSSGDMLWTIFRQGFSIIGVNAQGQSQSDLTLVHDTPPRQDVYKYQIWKL